MFKQQWGCVSNNMTPKNQQKWTNILKPQIFWETP